MNKPPSKKSKSQPAPDCQKDLLNHWRYFFTTLSFAMLIFALLAPTKGHGFWIIAMENASLLFLAIASIWSLFELGRYHLFETESEKKTSWLMVWGSADQLGIWMFSSGIILLVAARILTHLGFVF